MQMNEDFIKTLKAEEKELIEILKANPTLENVDIECIYQTPGYEKYKTWLFKYGKHDLLVILHDIGNGHYAYGGCLHEMIDKYC